MATDILERNFSASSKQYRVNEKRSTPAPRLCQAGHLIRKSGNVPNLHWNYINMCQPQTQCTMSN